MPLYWEHCTGTLYWNIVLEHCTGTLYWRGGAVASWLVHSTLDRAVRVRDLAGDIALCSWARQPGV